MSSTNGIHVGGSLNSGGGDIAGGDITKTTITTNPVDQIAIRELFAPIYKKIDTLISLSEKQRQYVKETVDDIQSEAEKGQNANPTFLKRRLTNLGKMAPDVLEVVLAVISNPIIGFRLIAEKIAKKAQAAGG